MQYESIQRGSWQEDCRTYYSVGNHALFILMQSAAHIALESLGILIAMCSRINPNGQESKITDKISLPFPVSYQRSDADSLIPNSFMGTKIPNPFKVHRAQAIVSCQSIIAHASHLVCTYDENKTRCRKPWPGRSLSMQLSHENAQRQKPSRRIYVRYYVIHTTVICIRLRFHY